MTKTTLYYYLKLLEIEDLICCYFLAFNLNLYK